MQPTTTARHAAAAILELSIPGEANGGTITTITGNGAHQSTCGQHSDRTRQGEVPLPLK